MRFLYFFFALVLFANNVNAQNQEQEHKFSILPTVGLTKPMLDNGFGLHVGLNPSVRYNRWLSAEGQVSYRHTRIIGAFMSSTTGYAHTADVLVGARFYLSPEDKKLRFYLNLMTGFQYKHQNMEDKPVDNSYHFGLSAGAFAEIDNFVIGFSADLPEYTLKIGYSF